MTILWFVIWLVSNIIGDEAPLHFDPVNWWGGDASPGGGARSQQDARDAPQAPLELVAFFLPVVRVVVVAVALPEAGLIGGEQLQAAQPLRALPEVAARHDQP